MKTNLALTKIILLAFLFAMIVTNIFAQKGGDNQKPQQSSQEMASPPPPPPPPPPPYQRIESTEDAPPPPLDLPDLSDVQKDKIKQADLKHMEAMTSLRNQMREKRARLMTILTTIPVNMKDADQVADDIGKVGSSILKQQIRHDQELRAILTPDQQIIFDSRPKPFLTMREEGRKEREHRNR